MTRAVKAYTPSVYATYIDAYVAGLLRDILGDQYRGVSVYLHTESLSVANLLKYSRIFSQSIAPC